MEKELSMKRYLAAQESLLEVTTKLNEAYNIIGILEAEKRQWIEEKFNQENIIKHQLNNSDSTVQTLQNEIRAIKSKLCKECYRKLLLFS